MEKFIFNVTITLLELTNMPNQENKERKIINNVILVIYFLLTALGLFGLIIADRITHFEFITHIIILNFVSMACVAFLLKKKIIALLIAGIVVIGSPAYYFNGYTNIKNSAPENFKTLTNGTQTFKFFSENESGTFILIEETEGGYVCNGSYVTNATECKRLGSRVFK